MRTSEQQATVDRVIDQHRRDCEECERTPCEIHATDRVDGTVCVSATAIISGRPAYAATVVIRPDGTGYRSHSLSA